MKLWHVILLVAFSILCVVESLPHRYSLVHSRHLRTLQAPYSRALSNDVSTETDVSTYSDDSTESSNPDDLNEAGDSNVLDDSEEDDDSNVDDDNDDNDGNEDDEEDDDNDSNDTDESNGSDDSEKSEEDSEDSSECDESGKSDKSGEYNDPTTPTPTPPPTPTTPTAPTATTNPNIPKASGEIWKPKVGSSWQIVIYDSVENKDLPVDIYDIDLWQNEKSTIDDLHAKNKKVICYFSAGTYEGWRPDAAKFKESEKGELLHDWRNERWLDIRTENVQNIMQNRIRVAKDKGCDGIDPDNFDGFQNRPGFELTSNDSTSYFRWVAEQAHKNGLAIGLKNTASIAGDVMNVTDFAVTEECVHYNDCVKYKSFIDNQQAVFHLEYPKGDARDKENVSDEDRRRACQAKKDYGFSTLIKNKDLDEWVQNC